MMRTLYKSKIHGATVTDAQLEYTGSITIDRNLLKAADIYPHERVQILNRNNGSRVETYVIEGAPGSGVICMNGPAARWAQVGDTLIIISYGLVTEEEAAGHKPRVVYVDTQNRPQKGSHGKTSQASGRG